MHESNFIIAIAAAFVTAFVIPLQSETVLSSLIHFDHSIPQVLVGMNELHNDLRKRRSTTGFPFTLSRQRLRVSISLSCLALNVSRAILPAIAVIIGIGLAMLSLPTVGLFEHTLEPSTCNYAYANELRKRRSTTGFAFTYCGGAIVCRSKTQGVNALSSTEAEFIAAVTTAAKTARYLRSMLTELGFPLLKPTRIFEDNASTIRIVNARVPTERTCHIDIRFFAIQAWKEQGDVILHHIPGIINPSDDLAKPLGWVLHSRHAPHLMGHYG